MSKNTHLLSEELQEWLPQKPQWLVRNGIYGILIFFLSYLLLSMFIRIPDIIVCKAIISSDFPAAKLRAKTTGRIEKFYIRDGAVVKTNDRLAILENTADEQMIFQLKELLDENGDRSLENFLSRIEALRHGNFGPLQASFSGLVQKLDLYNFYSGSGFFESKYNQITQKRMAQQRVLESLQMKDSLLKGQLKLENNMLHANAALLKEKVIAKLEYEALQKNFIEREVNLSNNTSAIAENTLKLAELSAELKSMQAERLQKMTELRAEIKQLAAALESEINNWEEKYVLIAPINGSISLGSTWSENHNVEQGTEILTVTPLFRKYVVKIQLPIRGYGKVKHGQKTLIKLDSYPFEEFGMLEGTVTHISNISIEGQYYATVLLPSNLVTTRKKTIEDQPEITGIAEVITSNKSLLMRLLENFRRRTE